MTTSRLVIVCSLAAAMAAWVGLLGGTPRDLAAADNEEPERRPATDDAGTKTANAFRPAGVRYQVENVDRSVAFYTKHLGFTLQLQAGPAFASVTNGSLRLLLSGPRSSGSRPLPDGRVQKPGGWNRVVLEVDDLAACVTAMKHEGLRFRNEIETGPGGKQIQLEDPDGNPVELFQPAS